MAEQAPSIEDRLNAYLTDEPKEAPEQTPEVAEQTPEVAEPVSQEVEGTDGEAEEVEGTKAAEEAEDGETVEVSSINDLAEHLGIEVADLYALEIPVTGADGNKVSVSIGEWKDGFQSSKMYAKQQAELQAERERFTQESQALQQKVQQELGVAANLIQTAEKALLSDIERIDWDSLRREDPGEFSAKRQEMLERQNTLENAKRDLVNRQTEQQRELTQKQSEELNKLRERETAALLEAFPAWKDQKVAQAEWSKAAEVLTEVGFAPSEIENVMDHRAYKLAMLAVKGAEASKKADVAKKRVLKIGKKVLKPGTAASKSDAAQDETRQMRAQLRKSGKPEDAIGLIRKIL